MGSTVTSFATEMRIHDSQTATVAAEDPVASALHAVCCIFFDVNSRLVARAPTQFPPQSDQTHHCALPTGPRFGLQHALNASAQKTQREVGAASLVQGSIDALQRSFHPFSRSLRLRFVGRPCSMLKAGSGLSLRFSATTARCWMLSGVST